MVLAISVDDRSLLHHRRTENDLLGTTADYGKTMTTGSKLFTVVARKHKKTLHNNRENGRTEDSIIYQSCKKCNLIKKNLAFGVN